MASGAISISPHGHSVPHRVHLVGIAGAGMRAMAEILLGMGWKVSGSDLAPPMVGLAALDPPYVVYQGHDAAHVPAETDLVIYSSAIAADNPELRRAAELGILRYSYFEMAGWLMRQRRGLAIAGTHGKSTTTAMAAQVLIEAGRDPTLLCGAAPLGRLSGGRAGRGPLMVVEACEYRANFLHLQPAQAVILGIEPDHFDCYPTSADLERAFGRFARSIPPDGLLLARHDCAATRRATEGLPCRIETFGFDERADWSAGSLHSQAGRYDLEICRGGRSLAAVRLQVPGRYNVLNALAAAALAWHNGVSPEGIARSLSGFRGLHRRLELLGTRDGVSVITDYAHHPTEVAAALGAVREMFPGRRLWCVFQPHQASRTAGLLDELAASLHNADAVLVADIFRAREGTARSGEVTAADLAERVCQISPGIIVPPAHGKDEIGAVLTTHLRPGDVLIAMGAGDVSDYLPSCAATGGAKGTVPFLWRPATKIGTVPAAPRFSPGESGVPRPRWFHDQLCTR